MLKERLQEAVALEEYEEAARLRDEIGRLEHSVGRDAMIVPIEGLDIAAMVEAIT